MPIEVRELIIRARIEEAPKQASDNGRSHGKKMDDREWEMLVALCTEEVLKVLDKQRER